MRGPASAGGDPGDRAGAGADRDRQDEVGRSHHGHPPRRRPDGRAADEAGDGAGVSPRVDLRGRPEHRLPGAGRGVLRPGSVVARVRDLERVARDHRPRRPTVPNVVQWYWGPGKGTYQITYTNALAWLFPGIMYAGPNLTPETLKQGFFAVPAAGGSASDDPALANQGARSGYGRTNGLPYVEYTRGNKDFTADLVGPEHRRSAVARLPGREGRAVLPRQREALLRRALADEADEVLRQVELDLSVRRAGGAARADPVHRLPERDRGGNSGGIVVVGASGHLTVVRFAWFTWLARCAERGSGWLSCRRGRSRSCSPISRVRRACGRSIPRRCSGALARHDEILRDAIAAHGGHVVKTTGDGVHAVFATAHDALDAAVTAQLALAAERSDETGPLRVRMGVHTCEAELRDGDYYGSEVNRAARLMSVAHGGQIVVSLATSELVRDGSGRARRSRVSTGCADLRARSGSSRCIAPGLAHGVPAVAVAGRVAGQPAGAGDVVRRPRDRDRRRSRSCVGASRRW